MEIVIDIAQNEYDALEKLDAKYLLHIIKDGTPLPKGHGDLKDIDRIEEAFWNDGLINKNMDSLDNGESQKMRRAMIRTMHLDVPTIIEADGGDDADEERENFLRWMSKFCRHIDMGDKPYTDAEAYKFWKNKMNQQFGWEVDNGNSN